MDMQYFTILRLTRFARMVDFLKNLFFRGRRRKELSNRTAKGIIQSRKKIDGKNSRCVFLQLNPEENVDNDGFASIDETQEELPFQ